MYHYLIAGGGPLRCIPIAIIEDWEINERMRELIHEVGLEYLARIGKMQIDHALISVLGERSRPEMNTFHLNSGEARVTLENVAYIYGLAIDGILVIGRTFSTPAATAKVCANVNCDCDGCRSSSPS